MPDIPTPYPHASGQARIKLNGRTVYLGKWGTPAAQQRYDEVIKAWLDNGRQWPVPLASGLTIGVACELYTSWAKRTFRKGERTTSTAQTIARVCDLLKLAGFARTLVAAFNVVRLGEFRQYLCVDTHKRWNRETINGHVEVVCGMFDWLNASGHLGDPSLNLDLLASLRSLWPLRAGAVDEQNRPIAREGEKVKPVPPADLEATLAKCTPVVADMIRVQLLTGMRPTELVRIRPCDLGPSHLKGVSVYTVAKSGNKVDHFGIDRLVAIGPKALEILRRWRPEDPMDYYFRPIEAHRYSSAAKTAAKKNKRWKSHHTAARRARRGQEPLRLNAFYTVGSYRQAIHNAAAKAGVTLWGPGQIRHSTADQLTRDISIHAAKRVLGHTNLSTTKLYVSVADRKSLEAALRFG